MPHCLHQSVKTVISGNGLPEAIISGFMDGGAASDCFSMLTILDKS
jgi:hypothetical protein